jgi:hypothetical protein
MLKRLNVFIWPIIITVLLIAILTYLINAQIIEHDFGKTLSGTFVGAWLAFVSNMFMRYQNQYRDDLAAGRRALYTIRNQIDDFANFRYAFQHSVAQVGTGIPTAPEWCLAKPMGFNFNSSNVFDYKSLAFLLSKQIGRNAYQQLQFVERTYLDLIARHSDLNGSAIDTQKTMSELPKKLANFRDISLKSLEPHLGVELIYRVRDQLRAVALRVDQDEQRYMDSYNMLNNALEEILGKSAKIPFIEIPDKFKKDNLPSLPESLRSYVNQQIGQGN